MKTAAARTDELPLYANMGPTMLATQPRLPAGITELRPAADWPSIYAHLDARIRTWKNWRWSWWAHHAILAEYFLPRRYQWLITPNRMSKGSPINNAIIDSTATISSQICGSGMWTGLTSPSRPWFKLTVGIPWFEPDEAGLAWLEAVEQRAYTVLGRSNFYTIMAQAFQDVAVFGTAPILAYEDNETIVRFYLPCAGEYYLASGARFSVDSFGREFNLTVSQLVEMFGLENVPSSIQRLWEEGGASIEHEVTVCHVIEPNFEIKGRGRRGSIKPVAGRFPYREFYWVRGYQDSRDLSRRGFYERPFVALRWSTVSNDPYGRSPAMDALGDQRQLQTETRRKGELIEKLVRPPMGADVQLKNEPASIIPAAITYMDTSNGQKRFWPLFEVNPSAIPAITADIEKVSARIERCFFVDLFMAITRMEGVQPRNQLELTKRDLERLQQLGPFITMFETEVADPLITRTLAIMDRRGAIPPRPRSLIGIPLKFEYKSIMRMAQQSVESLSIKDTLVTAGQMAAAAQTCGAPSPVRLIDLDKTLRSLARLNAFPHDCLKPEAVVIAEDKAMAKLHQQQHDQAQMMQAGQIGVKAAKTLSETPVGGPSALTALMGGSPASVTNG